MEEINANPEQVRKPGPNGISLVIVVLLGIILVILTCNLGATGYLIYESQQSADRQNASTNAPLPAELDSAQAKKALFEKFREPFNNKNDDELYALLDPLIQVEITREKFDQQMPLIYQIGSNIKNGVYSHYEYGGISRGRKVFVLYYMIETENGTAMLDITIAQADQEPYTIWGFHIDLQ